MQKKRADDGSQDNSSADAAASLHSHWRHVFDGSGNSVVHWTLHAEALLDAAAHVRKSLLVFRRKLFRVRKEPKLAYYDSAAEVFLFLQGLAIECLLKAKWLASDGTLANDGKYLGIKGAGDHNLRQIVYQCQQQFSMKQQLWRERKSVYPSDRQREHIFSDKRQLNFTDRQLYLLDQLSQYIVWAGRYPIPRTAALYYPQAPNNQLLRAPSVGDFEEIDEIVKVIKRTMAPVEWRELAPGEWMGVIPDG